MITTRFVCAGVSAGHSGDTGPSQSMACFRWTSVSAHLLVCKHYYYLSTKKHLVSQKCIMTKTGQSTDNYEFC